MNIIEDFCSVEVAKLLKEKGFDGECTTGYFNERLIDYTLFGFCDGEILLTPTLQMAMKWLREVYNLHCSVDYDYVLGWYCQITNLKETVECDDYEEMKHYHPEKDNNFSSQEEACEEAIKYCLTNLR